jgi:hypothetical protein
MQHVAYQQPSHYFKEEKRTMKKFFKALALVLALTLVIGAIPVSAAASSFKLTGINKKGGKIIYLGGSEGEDKDGKKCPAKNYFDLTTHIDGFDAETMDIKLKAVDDSVVSTWNKSDRIFAKKIGKTVVTIYIYDAETGKLLDSSLKVKVHVKKNATQNTPALPFYVLNEKGELVTDPTQKFGVNVDYTVVLTRKDAEGQLTDTDCRSLTSEQEGKGVTIVPINEYKTAYKVTFDKAGEFTFHAAAYQSETYNKELVSEDIKVVAGYTPVDAKQSGLKSADVTFLTDVKGLEAKNFNAYYLVNDVKVYPTSAQKVECNGNVATVTFLSDFIQGETFYIEYTGEAAGSFKAASFSADSVVAIEIPAQEIEVGTNKALTYKLLDENGLDIKELLGSTLNGVLSFELENGDIDTYVTSGNAPEVYIGTVNKSYTVKAVYSWINSNGDEKKAEGKGVVASVAAAPWVQGQVTGVLSNAGVAYVKDDASGLNDAKPVTQWSLSDGNMGLQIAVPFTKNGTTKYESYTTAGSVAGLYTSYEVKSADEGYVMIGSIEGNKINLIANKAGETTILVYGVKDGVQKVVGAVPVKVVDGRKATTFKVTASKNSINSAYLSDVITFTLEVKDQFGADYKANDIKVESINKTDKTPKFIDDGADDIPVGSYDVYGPWFYAEEPDPDNEGEVIYVHAAGTVNLKFSVNNTGLSQTVFIKVGNDAVAQMQTLKLSAAKLQTGVKDDTEIKSLIISLEGRTKEGYAINGAPIYFSGTALKTRSADSSATNSGIDFEYFYTVSKDGAVKSAADLGAKFDEDGYPDFGVFFPDGNAFLNVISSDGTASGSAIKLAAGTYTVTAYRQTLNGNNIIVSSIGTQQFVVEDNQLQAEVARQDGAESIGEVLTADSSDALKYKAYKVTFNGADVTDKCTFVISPNGDGSTAYVSSVYFYVGNENEPTGLFKVTKDIGEVVRK